MAVKNPKKYLSKAECLSKLQRYCAYQDRCHKEVRSKLLKLGIYGDDLEEIMASLISDNYLNEERFAKSFARGKFRIRQWGRNRIQLELKRRDISEYCITKAMQEIDEETYLRTLKAVIEKKAILLKIKEADSFKRKAKLAKFAIGKGYESSLVWKILEAY